MKKINTLSEFEEALKGGRILVDFYTEWCGPCKAMAPILAKFDEKANDVVLYKVDAGHMEVLVRQFNINSVPTLILFESGREVRRATGFQTQTAIEKLVK